ncbi:MAG: hypothetical protein LUE99_16160 [Bacteroides sp.]|nr:hypothetical protein [Bacteroides sp.]
MKHPILNCAVVKGTGNPVYLVLHGKKYEISGEEVAAKLFTYPYHTKVTDKCLNSLPAGETLSTLSRLIAGADKKVYLSINDSIKLPFSDTATFDELGFDAGKV